MRRALDLQFGPLFNLSLALELPTQTTHCLLLLRPTHGALLNLHILQSAPCKIHLYRFFASQIKMKAKKTPY